MYVNTNYNVSISQAIYINTVLFGKLNVRQFSFMFQFTKLNVCQTYCVYIYDIPSDEYIMSGNSIHVVQLKIQLFANLSKLKIQMLLIKYPLRMGSHNMAFTNVIVTTS